jgi:RNA polymerase sigma-70 factor, ECF subfamily
MTSSSTPERVPDIEARLLERARGGDARAFEALVRRYDAALRSLAFRLLGDRDRMDDALQEAYVKAFRGLPSFRGESRLGTWLHRIAYNACVDELERSRKVVRLPLDELGDRPDPAAPLDAAAESRSELADALRALPLEERAAVLLVDAHDFTYEEAADVLGVPPGTIASRLNRARPRLRRALGGRLEGAGGR